MSAAHPAPLTPSLDAILKNILVATDFSACSDAAIRLAATLARQHHSQLTLLHAIPPEPMLQIPMEPTSWEYPQVRNRSEHVLEQLRSSPVLEGIAVRLLTEANELLPAIERLARDERIDLVVVGTHGRTGFSKLFRGSVAEEVERLIECPVLTVGPQARSEVLSSPKFQNILYATDFSAGSEHAMSYAIAFANESNAKLLLLHVTVEEMATAFYVHESVERGARQRLGRMIPAGALFNEPDIVVVTGLPANEIVKHAMTRAADLVVMGVHRSGMRGAYLSSHIPWSVVSTVIAHAPCPVLTVCGKPF